MFFAKKDLFEQLVKQLLGNNRLSQRSLAERYGRLIEEAKKEWREDLFNTVTEPISLTMLFILYSCQKTLCLSSQESP